MNAMRLKLLYAHCKQLFLGGLLFSPGTDAAMALYGLVALWSLTYYTCKWRRYRKAAQDMDEIHEKEAVVPGLNAFGQPLAKDFSQDFADLPAVQVMLPKIFCQPVGSTAPVRYFCRFLHLLPYLLQTAAISCVAGLGIWLIYLKYYENTDYKAGWGVKVSPREGWE
jgi:hypothetical protein